jgi:protein-S-isoprenylcysteine O-methyltransferase Ste14
MLTLRGIIFSVFVPGMIGGYIPWLLHEGASPATGIAFVGWVLVAAGVTIYFLCLLRFLAAGATPMIYFARALRFAFGEEPDKLLDKGLYHRSRNPMYVGVIGAALGQAIAFKSFAGTIYALALIPWFHFVVTILEEPHLRRKMGSAYDDYCAHVPRWL